MLEISSKGSREHRSQITSSLCDETRFGFLKETTVKLGLEGRVAF